MDTALDNPAAAIIAQAALWAADLYERRTILVGTNQGDSTMVDESTRVPWPEVVARFPTLSDLDARIEFQPIFNREIKRRKLWRVLQGRQTAYDWCQYHHRVPVAT